jgi:1,4-alpha-glucan branching enzyme
MPRPLSTSDVLAAIAEGEHGDPFSVLGPHPVDDVIVLRVLAPGARRVRAKLARRVIALERVRDGGIFEGTILPAAKAPIDPGTGRLRYRLEVTGDDGNIVVRDDPYRFGPVLGEEELARLATGEHLARGEALGAHVSTHEGARGVRFAVWAPSARRASVVGGWNGWNGVIHPMRPRGMTGIWELFLPDLDAGAYYKYEILPPRGPAFMKTDPAGGFTELRPGTASIVVEDVRVRPPRIRRGRTSVAAGVTGGLDRPISIYEVHPGSWRREPDGISPHGRWLTWNELADMLVPYVADLGFTHLELMPVTEHPFDGSWGYQSTGYFAPTSRYGTPAEFARFVEAARDGGLGILLDWVPAHFPRDVAGLARFDGTPLYEHADPRRGAHPDWGTLIFDWGKREVSDFLVSSALHWLDRFGLAGLRVDAVASMLYLDYSRKPGEWLPNKYGGRENLDAIDFLRRLNDEVHARHPGTLTCAEESTAWPGVTQPARDGGLGFDLKWNMGWMHDTLAYFAEQPVHRRFHHDRLTFVMYYAFSERFLLPLSHDEVVHLKKALVSKMPGDKWQRFANLRALYATQWANPGKKLLFMGAEIAQWAEWNHATQLDWWLLDDPEEGVFHRGVQALVRDLNLLYRERKALHENEHDWTGFEWIDFRDKASSVVAYRRIARDPSDFLVVVANYTPTVRRGYRIGLPADPSIAGYREVLNTDATAYGGSGVGNAGRVEVEPVAAHGQEQSIGLVLPPLSLVFLEPIRVE